MLQTGPQENDGKIRALMRAPFSFDEHFLDGGIVVWNRAPFFLHHVSTPLFCCRIDARVSSPARAWGGRPPPPRRRPPRGGGA